MISLLVSFIEKVSSKTIEFQKKSQHVHFSHKKPLQTFVQLLTTKARV